MLDRRRRLRRSRHRSIRLNSRQTLPNLVKHAGAAILPHTFTHTKQRYKNCVVFDVGLSPMLARVRHFEHIVCIMMALNAISRPPRTSRVDQSVVAPFNYTHIARWLLSAADEMRCCLMSHAAHTYLNLYIVVTCARYIPRCADSLRYGLYTPRGTTSCTSTLANTQKTPIRVIVSLHHHTQVTLLSECCLWFCFGSKQDYFWSVQ